MFDRTCTVHHTKRPNTPLGGPLARIVALSLLAATPLMMVAACHTEPRNEEERSNLSGDVQATLNRFRNTDPSLITLMRDAVGYAVLPDVGKAGLIVGGAYGNGEVYEGGHRIGYCDVTQGSIGAQIGAQSFSEVIVFLRQSELDNFKESRFEFTANASAVALRAGAAKAANYDKGVVVLVEPRGGLMAEASVGGQKFRFRPL